MKSCLINGPDPRSPHCTSLSLLHHAFVFEPELVLLEPTRPIWLISICWNGLNLWLTLPDSCFWVAYEQLLLSYLPPKHAAYPDKLVLYLWRMSTVGNPSIAKRLPCSFISGWCQKPRLQTDGHMLYAHLSPSLLPFLSLRWLIVKIIPSAAICVR